jgi:hypothetical protein
MDLIHNSVFKIIGGEEDRIYRVVLNEIRIKKVAIVGLDQPSEYAPHKGGRKKFNETKKPRKKPPMPFIGQLIWKSHSELQRLYDQSELIVLDSIEADSVPLSPADKPVFERRKAVMKPFLEFEHLREQILACNGIGGLVKEAKEASKASAYFIYKCFSMMCRYGFLESSLKPALHRCGAPEVSRPCDPGGRKKAGAKTIKQKIAKARGVILEPEQPGVSAAWRSHIIAADSKIPTPKPSMSERCKTIVESAFVRRYKQEDGKLVPMDPKLGEYPNNRQIRRVLEVEIPRLQRLLEKTTLGHFKRALRGLTARNWKGVSGPGHTWAIDSTIGDIYLRSSLNRSWIIGRPVVYIVVDVWSTAIVGFYVCLTGPSWDTAKVSLFSSAASPELMGELWGYQPILSLYPAPTLPAILLCDRGEYLSIAASLTGMKLIPCLSYTPPYRPDMKGLVEVLHRIEKDKQYFFLPGAIDQRRKEFELRKFNPNEAVLTVADYTQYLYTIFAEYNLTAPREKRIDAHMKADGVFPSPSGLWRWGHKMGVGVRRDVPISELITNLLPSDIASVTRHGVMLGGKQYESRFIDNQQWTALARNFVGWDITAYYFPGSVSRIWTRNTGSPGLIDLKISDQSTASPELTFDEVADAIMYANINKANVAHEKMLLALQSRRRVEEIIANAKVLTADAIARDSGPSPTMTEARNLETSFEAPAPKKPHESQSEIDATAYQMHLEMMQLIMAAANEDALPHG